MMIRIASAFALCCALAAPAAAETRVCNDVSGKLNEFILPQSAAPNDPFGRILGTIRGSFQGATTAFLTSFRPSPSGDIDITVNDTFSTEDGNLLYTQGVAHWAAVKPGFLQVNLTLAIAGGTGKYASATGTLKVLGIGNNIGPGTGQFVQEYRGTICVSQ